MCSQACVSTCFGKGLFLIPYSLWSSGCSTVPYRCGSPWNVLINKHLLWFVSYTGIHCRIVSPSHNLLLLSCNDWSQCNYRDHLTCLFCTGWCLLHWGFEICPWPQWVPSSFSDVHPNRSGGTEGRGQWPWALDWKKMCQAHVSGVAQTLQNTSAIEKLCYCFCLFFFSLIKTPASSLQSIPCSGGLRCWSCQAQQSRYRAELPGMCWLLAPPCVPNLWW